MTAEELRVERIHYAGPGGGRRPGWDVQYRDVPRDRVHDVFVPDVVLDAIAGSGEDPDGPVRRLAIRAHVHLGEVVDAAAKAHEVVRMLAGATVPRPAAGSSPVAPAVLRQVRT
jgi:hypothetical protein